MVNEWLALVMRSELKNWSVLSHSLARLFYFVCTYWYIFIINNIIIGLNGQSSIQPADLKDIIL